WPRSRSRCPRWSAPRRRASATRSFSRDRRPAPVETWPPPPEEQPSRLRLSSSSDLLPPEVHEFKFRPRHAAQSLACNVEFRPRAVNASGKNRLGRNGWSLFDGQRIHIGRSIKSLII